MKKIIALLLVCTLLVCAFAGCAAKQTEAESTPAETTAEQTTPAAEEPAAEQTEEPAAEQTEEEWTPDGPITIVVGMKEGGGIDTMARTMATGISEYLGVDVIVENMPGSSSGLAADYIVEQPADGYKLFACSSSICGFATTENSDVTYKDLDVLCMPFTTHNPAILVNANSGITTMEQWLEWVKSTPTTASTAGVGSTWHIPAAMIAGAIGADVTYVPYDSGKETTLAVSRGEVDWTACGIYQESSEAILSGLVTPLCVCSGTSFNLEGYGEVPSILDSIPELSEYADVLGGWRGFAVAAGTPANVEAKLTEALEYAVNTEAMQTLLANNGVAESPVLYGADAQALLEKTVRMYSWLLYDLGDGTRSPEDVGVSRWEE